MAIPADSDPGMTGRRWSGPPGLAVLLGLLLPAALLAGAYIGEYGFGLYPCEMCWWQRYAHFAALPFGALAILAFARGAAAPARVLTLLAGLAILVSGLIGGYHAGVEYGWWEGVSACTSVPEPAAGEDFWQTMMDMPVVRCDRAPFTLFGISLAGYNFLISTIGAVAIILLAVTERTGGAER